METMKPKGLAERMRDAKTIDELEALIQEGKGYQDPSLQTRRRWERIAEAKRAALSKK
jgi:hypothetical protein